MSLKHTILVLLETEPSSGYDLLKQFKGGLGYFWNAKHQQIYQQLKTMSEDGLIEFSVVPQEGKPDKKVYAITTKGVKELKRWLTLPAKPSKVNDALLVKIYGGKLTEDGEIEAELERYIERNEKTLKELLKIEQTYLSLPEAQKERYRFPYITLRRGILDEQALIEWAKEAREMIKK